MAGNNKYVSQSNLQVFASQLKNILDGRYSAKNHIHDDATTLKAGFMSTADKTKLDKIVLEEIVKRDDFLKGTSTPVGSKVPSFIGQIYIDTNTKITYIATGLTNSDWLEIGLTTEVTDALGGKIDKVDFLSGSTAPTEITAKFIGQVYIDTNTGSVYNAKSLNKGDFIENVSLTKLQKLLTGKADVVHNHNDAYYIKSEVNTKLDTKLNKTLSSSEANKVMITDASGNIVPSSTITTSLLNHLVGLNAPIQGQIDNKVSKNGNATNTILTTNGEGVVQFSSVIPYTNLPIGNSASTVAAGNHKHTVNDITVTPGSEIVVRTDFKELNNSTVNTTKPNFIGQIGIDKSTGVLYVAYGTETGNWKVYKDNTKLEQLLGTKANKEHKHDANDINTGVLNADRLPKASTSSYGAIKIGNSGSDAAAGNHIHAKATNLLDGFMSKEDKIKLDSLSNYTHPTGDGHKHVPANGTTNTNKFLKATATAGVYEWSELPIASESQKGIVKLGNTATDAAKGDHTHAIASRSTNGFMSSTDKTNLDNHLADNSKHLTTQEKTNIGKIPTLSSDVETAKGDITGLEQEIEKINQSIAGSAKTIVVENKTEFEALKINELAEGTIVYIIDPNGCNIEGVTFPSKHEAIAVIVYASDDSKSWKILSDDLNANLDAADVKYSGTIDSALNVKAALDYLQTNKAKLNGWTADRIIVSGSNGSLSVSGVSSDKLAFLSNVSSDIQTQIDAKANKSHTHTIEEITDFSECSSEEITRMLTNVFNGIL